MAALESATCQFGAGLIFMCVHPQSTRPGFAKCSCRLLGSRLVLEEAESAFFPLWPRLVGVESTGEVVSGSLEGADKSRHTGAGADGDGERAALETRDETSRTATRGAVQSVVGLELARVRRSGTRKGRAGTLSGLVSRGEGCQDTGDCSSHRAPPSKSMISQQSLAAVDMHLCPLPPSATPRGRENCTSEVTTSANGGISCRSR